MQKFFLNDIVTVKGMTGLYRVCGVDLPEPKARMRVHVCPAESILSLGLVSVNEDSVSLADAHLYPNGQHPHADAMLAYARGAEIEVCVPPAVGDKFVWLWFERPSFLPTFKYRIKDQPKKSPALVAAEAALASARKAVEEAEAQVKKLGGAR